jgi:hypothetical protein
MQLEYQQRRQTLMDKIGAGTAIFRSAPMAVMHNDVEYNFRQDSDFFYLPTMKNIGLCCLCNRKTRKKKPGPDIG